MKTFISIIMTFTVFAVLTTTNTAHAISIPEENELAKKFMSMIHRQQMLLKDPVSQHFVNQIGRHILAQIPPQPFKYSFYVVNGNLFNAFAAPGANIFVYRGLITSLDTIDQLAGIIGHEIAHAVSRHVSESIDRSKYVNLGTLAGILAGAIIGSEGDSEAAAAVVRGSMALGVSSMLSFTRENETEADEKGVLLLKSSCFSPTGLLGGLNKIREADFSGVEGIPDYEKTHPGTGKRIAHTETILSNYQPPPDKPQCSVNFDFQMVKHRLLGLYAPIDATLADLEIKLKTDPENAPLHYGFGLALARKQQLEKAITHLKMALNFNFFDPMILTDLGRIYLLNGQPDKALNVLQGVESEPVIGVMARLYQSEAYLEKSDFLLAERGYRAVINKAPGAFPEAYFNLAKIKSINKEKGLSHYYLGIHYTLVRNVKNAKYHLNKSIEELSDPDKIDDAKKRLKRLEKKS